MGKLIDVQGEPFRGGCITALEKALLPMGALSMAQNIRNTHPGFKSRSGYTDQHTSAFPATYGIDTRVDSLFQFRKTRVDEKHFYAQLYDGKIIEATNAPPAITTGDFGIQRSFVGSTEAGVTMRPASWSVLNDILLLGAGGQQHKLFHGNSSPVDRFLVHGYCSADITTPTLTDRPDGGGHVREYSNQVRDENLNTSAPIGNLEGPQNGGAFFVKTALPASKFHFTVGQNNGVTNSFQVAYKVKYGTEENSNYSNGISDGNENLDGYTQVTPTDGTKIGTMTLAQNGTMELPGSSYNALPQYQFGEWGYWYRFTLDPTIPRLNDTTVTITGLKYESHWKPLINKWNGIKTFGVEALVENSDEDGNPNGTFSVYGTQAIDVSLLPTTARIFIAFSDPVQYFKATTEVDSVGLGLEDMEIRPIDQHTNLNDDDYYSETNYFQQRSPSALEYSSTWAFWYEVVWSRGEAIPEDTIIAVEAMPWFNINDFGYQGNVVTAWKNRACYTFDQYPSFIYVSAENEPMVLNGVDFGILQAGDGRSNRVVNLKKFHNELIAFQEEKGAQGGTVTLFEGYSPTTFGKLVLSSQIGTMNAKSAVVVDGVLTSTKTDESLKTLCFFLSRYGVAATDGKTISIISDDIGNYFDPSKEECIRRGYEDLMWLEHDAADNVLRLGLVSGSSATRVNVFPVFDLVTKTWSFDVYSVGAPSCMANIDSGSGAKPVMQVAGDASRGYVMILNNNTNFDNGYNDIRCFLNIVLTHKGLNLVLREMAIRVKTMLAVTGVIPAVYPGYDNPLQITFVQDQKESEANACQKELTPEFSGQASRRHYFLLNQVGNIIEIRIDNSYNAYPLGLHDMGLKVDTWTQRQ